MVARRLKLILASASPRRRILLKKLGIPFRVKASHVSEASPQKNPAKLVEELALRKASEIAKTMPSPRPSPTLRMGEGENKIFTLARRRREREGVRAWVLGADTVVVLNGKILGKPTDAADAYRMLYRLSGSRHQVYTGVALVEAGGRRQWVRHARSDVRMDKMPVDQILRLSRRHMDKAGAYAIQDRNDPYAHVIKGTYENVVGLPLDVVKKLFKKAKIP